MQMHRERGERKRGRGERKRDLRDEQVIDGLVEGILRG